MINLNQETPGSWEDFDASPLGPQEDTMGSPKSFFTIDK